jgi:general secretion pathway protein K
MTIKNNNSLKKQNGIALVLVLWMLSLLIILATGYSRMMRTETLLTANQVNSAKAYALAEAGISLAISELLEAKDEQRLKTDGTIYPRNFNQHTINFSVRAESGKIDINTASSELLYGLLQASDVPEKSLLPLLHALLDWRDKDNLVRAYGAEDSDYNNIGLKYGAKDGAFNSIDELLLVKGMTPKLFSVLKPSITVYSHQGGVYLHAASRDVLFAIPNLSESDIDNYLAEREAADNENTVIPPGGIDPKYLARTKAAIYTINSEAIVNKTTSAIEAVVLLQKNDNVPYSVLSWHELPLQQSKDNLIDNETS